MEHFLNMDYGEKEAKSMKNYYYLSFVIAELTCVMFSLFQFMVLKYDLGTNVE